MAIEYRPNVPEKAKPKAAPQKPVPSELMKKIAEIETRKAPAPKKGIAEPQKVKSPGKRLVASAKQVAAGDVTVAKKGRPKKGEPVTKLVPVTVMVNPDLARAMKSASGWQDKARLALDFAFSAPAADTQEKS